MTELLTFFSHQGTSYFLWSRQLERTVRLVLQARDGRVRRECARHPPHSPDQLLLDHSAQSDRRAAHALQSATLRQRRTRHQITQSAHRPKRKLTKLLFSNKSKVETSTIFHFQYNTKFLKSKKALII
jgi:hypothetical protein